MNRGMVKRWVAALESGDYDQVRGRLFRYKLKDGRVAPGYCCLGVACAVLEGDLTPFGGALYLTTNHHDLAMDIGVDDQCIERKLMRLNDRGKRGFPYIARWIRKNILGEDIIIDVNRAKLRRKKGK